MPHSGVYLRLLQYIYRENNDAGTMARIKIELPPEFSFTTRIPVRITDINYGNHVGNDAVLSIVHEARMQWLAQWNFNEMNFGGTGMIMTDAALEFRREMFYGDRLLVSVAVADISRVGFDLYYKLEVNRGAEKDEMLWVASAKTGMLCYDYERRKIVPIPDEVRKLLE